MRRRVLGTRRFSLADQNRFAALAGDFNPLHVDPTAARRTMFGEPVVHGMHAVVWALERYLGLLRQRRETALSIRSLAVTFSKPIYLEERVGAYLMEQSAERARIQVIGREAVLADLTLQ